MTMAILKFILLIFFTIFLIPIVDSHEKVSDGNNGLPSEYATKDDIQKLLDLIKHQDRKISELNIEMKQKDQALAGFDERVSDLEALVLHQSKKISELEAREKIQNKWLKKVDKDTKNAYARKMALKTDNTNNFYSKTSDYSAFPEHLIVKEKKKKHEVKHNGHYKRTAIGARVSFSAYISHLVEHLGIRQTVRFDQVIINDGNGYNALTGVFTVPVTGTYVFTFYVSSSNANVQFDLMADGSLKTSGVARPSEFNTGKDVQGGGTVILRLSKGASVWIESHYADGTVFSQTSHRWITFSGFLLY